VDFLYTCPGHLTDNNFASEVGESGDGVRGSGPSPEEILKVKEEWEERQKQKAEKAKERDAAKEKEKEGSKDEGGEKDKKESKATEVKTPKISGTPTGSTPTPTSTHKRFALHRDFFAMRLSEHRRRKRVTQAKELAPRLPGVPRGNIDGSS
jgi:hypothetical protein